MENINYFTFARALHVIGVVLWIGGMAFVTTVLIPSLRNITDSANPLELFEQLEGKFSFQAKIKSQKWGEMNLVPADQAKNIKNAVEQRELYWLKLPFLAFQYKKANVGR